MRLGCFYRSILLALVKIGARRAFTFHSLIPVNVNVGENPRAPIAQRTADGVHLETLDFLEGIKRFEFVANAARSP